MPERAYGELVVDARARECLHFAEQRRVGQWKQQQQAIRPQGMDPEVMRDVAVRGMFYAESKAAASTDQIRANQVQSLVCEVDLTSLFGPQTPCELLTVAVANGMSQQVRLHMIRDTGVPDSVISEKLANMLHLRIEHTKDSFSMVGSTTEVKFEGICRGVQVCLYECLVVTVDLYVVTG